jgi:hypothetical protein
MIMDLPISKDRMKLTIKILERRAAELNDVARFRGIKVTTEHFDADHLVMLCNLFANEWHETQELSNSLLESQFVGEINRAYVKHTLLNKFADEAGSSPIKYKKPLSVWRKLWNMIKG